MRAVFRKGKGKIEDGKRESGSPRDSKPDEVVAEAGRAAAAAVGSAAAVGVAAPAAAGLGLERQVSEEQDDCGQEFSIYFHKKN